MKPARFSHINISAFGLVFAFVATSIILPAIYSQNIFSQSNTVTVSKSSSDSGSQNGQLPLAENEKEEENQTERSAEYSFEFCLNQFLYPVNVVTAESVVLLQIPYSLTSTEVPLYLFKRTLLI